MADLFDDIVQFLKNPVGDGLPLEATPQSLDACRHRKVYIDEEARKVVCRECEKELDPFWYLCLLTREWKLRRYHDERVIEAHQALAQQEANRQGRGWYYHRPAEGPGAAAWDQFRKWLGHEPYAVFYRGQWMATDGNKSTWSLSYAQGQMRRKELEELK